MKTEISPTPAGITKKIVLDDETYLLITDAENDERIDFDLLKHVVRIYSDKPWHADIFKRSGAKKAEKPKLKERARQSR